MVSYKRERCTEVLEEVVLLLLSLWCGICVPSFSSIDHNVLNVIIPCQETPCTNAPQSTMTALISFYRPPFLYLTFKLKNERDAIGNSMALMHHEQFYILSSFRFVEIYHGVWNIKSLFQCVSTSWQSVSTIPTPSIFQHK